MIIILNAPPNSGKDTIADIIKSKYRFKKTEFKATMFEIATALSGLTLDEYMERYNNRELKEVPWSKLGGKSCREFMIHISEDIMKPLYGDKIFGKRASEFCHDATQSGYNVIFSDGGFIDEVEQLIEDGHEVVIARLWREGYTFDNDSRDYLYTDKCKCIDIILEDGEPDKAARQIIEEAL